MVDPLQLLGQVAAMEIQRSLDAGRGDGGFARILLYPLGVDEVAAIVRAILDDPALSPRLEIRLPRYRFGGVAGLPDEVLTDVAMTEWRHEACAREGRVMALVDDSQLQSMAQVDKLDAELLLGGRAAKTWVEKAQAGNSSLDVEAAVQWTAALQGILQMERFPVRQIAAFVARTMAAIEDGCALHAALGRALPALSLPRYDALFQELPVAKRHQPSQWRQKLTTHLRRECYLSKRDRSQVPLSRTDLRKTLENIRERLSRELLGAITNYIDAPDGQSGASQGLFEFDWAELRDFFEGGGTRETVSLGKETQTFVNLLPPGSLSEADQRYVGELMERGANPTKGPEDEEFYAAHAQTMREEPRLVALWDRFIYGSEVSCSDFWEGLAIALRRLYQPEPGVDRVIVIRGNERGQNQFLPLNHEACLFFATHYRGLYHGLRGQVEFRDALAFEYPTFASDRAFAEHARRAADATSRKARQLRFDVWLETRPSQERVTKTRSVRLVWECDLDAIGLGLADDLKHLRTSRRGTPLLRLGASRRRAGGGTRARTAGLSLADLSALEPSSSRQRGSFVPSVSKGKSLAEEWKAALADLSRGATLVPAEQRAELEAAFLDFESAYRRAIEDLNTVGATAPSLSHQATAYGALLAAVTRIVEKPLGLELLLRPILEVGVVTIQGAGATGPMVIVCPWHPLRLGAQHARVLKLCRVLVDLLSSTPPGFTDNGGLFFTELARSLTEPTRPDVVVAWVGAEPKVLALTDVLHDYSLHEEPIVSAADPARAGSGTNENARPTARQVADLVQSYLQLQPHERDNLSVVLYNSDSAALPQAVVDTIRAEAEGDGGEAMCQVILRHVDESRLRDLYQQLVARDVGEDGLHASEATRDFMSRLRISLMVNQSAPAAVGSGPPLDIVFCQDVISRQAKLAWIDVPRITRLPQVIEGGQWSRRQPVGEGEHDAVLYLVCPVHPEEGWAYLDAVSALHAPDLMRAARERGACRVPARSTDVRSPKTQQALEETHRLGQWVVNFDDLLDRRQLLSNQIRIIRYKRAASGGRNLVISSRASDSLLRATLRNRLRALDLGLNADATNRLIDRLIDDANQVSGDLVLRAARRGANASELIGVVLSKFLVEAELGRRPAAWAFLDDYAAWLGQDEKRIADLLCMAPATDPESGEPYLDVIVTEAKYVKAGSMATKARDSGRQLHDTLTRLEAALQPSGPPPADRSIWLGRLADILQDGLPDLSRAVGLDPRVWRTAVRDGVCRIRLRGYSHVFGAPDERAPTEDVLTGVLGTKTGHQERYAPASVRAIMLAYAGNKSPMAVRSAIAPDGFYATSTLQPTAASTGGTRPTDMPNAEASATTKLAATGGASALTAPASPASSSALMTPGTASEARFRSVLKQQAQRWDDAAQDDAGAWLTETASRCRTALLRYGLAAKLQQEILTPNAALLKFRGSDDMTVAKVEARISELRTTHGLEVLSVRGELGLVTVSIARPHRQVLHLAQVWRSWEPSAGEANGKLLVAIKEEDGQPLFLEPEPAPHSLIAGSTGSGKSVLVQNILLGIGATNSPEQAQLILIDPKAGVDYFSFEALPHLDGGRIIDDPDQALERLTELVAEMERRYTLFREARVSNIRAYHRKVGLPLPLIWLVHDEFADWMQLDHYRTGVEAAVSRLGVKARAAGIYLIFAAQRPDNTVFPMQLRSNLGNRLVLRVDSPGTSELSLGLRNGGAERLLGQGHLAAILGGGTEPLFAQVPYIAEQDLTDLVEAIAADYSGSSAQ